MTRVEIQTSAATVVEVTGNDNAVVEFAAVPPPAEVDVLTEGVQGTRGLPGEDAEVPDPGDLILYFQNGLT